MSWPLAPTPLARLAAGASKRWRFLQERHGDLGWRPCRLRLHGAAAGWRPLSAWWPLPFAQVDSAVLAARLPLVLAAAGVRCKKGRVERLEPQAGAGWDWLAQASTGHPQPHPSLHGRDLLGAQTVPIEGIGTRLRGDSHWGFLSPLTV